MTNILSYETLRSLFVNVYTDTFKEMEADSFVQKSCKHEFSIVECYLPKIRSLFNNLIFLKVTRNRRINELGISI